MLISVDMGFLSTALPRLQTARPQHLRQWQPRRGKLRPRPGTTASSAALYQLYVLKRQTAHRLAGCRKNCVEHGWRNHADCRFPNSAPEVVGRHNHRFNLRHLGKTHNFVTVEVEIGHASVLDRHFAVE